METILTLSEVSWRHKVRDFSSWKPWAKRDGAGIYSIDMKIKPGTILGLIGQWGGKNTYASNMGLYDCDGFNKSCEIRRIEIGYMRTSKLGRKDYCIKA